MAYKPLDEPGASLFFIFTKLQVVLHHESDIGISSGFCPCTQSLELKKLKATRYRSLIDMQMILSFFAYPTDQLNI